MTFLSSGNKKVTLSREGVSLLEIMLALVVLSVAALGAAGIISHGHKETAHDFRRGEALQILVDRMNFLSSLPFKTLTDTIGSAVSKTLNANYKNVSFGEVTVGKNVYDVSAILKKQAVTFDNLKELSFPNKNYKYNEPNTWRFRPKSSESFANNSGDYAYAVIKVTVNVTPKDVKSGKLEKTYSAITFVCATE